MNNKTWYRVSAINIGISPVTVTKETDKCIYILKKGDKDMRVYKRGDYANYFQHYDDAVEFANGLIALQCQKYLGYLFQKHANVIAEIIQAIAVSDEAPKFLKDATADIFADICKIRQAYQPITAEP